MKLTLSGTFLTPMETPLCVKLRTQQGGTFANKGPSSEGYGFSSSHVWM